MMFGSELELYVLSVISWGYSYQRQVSPEPQHSGSLANGTDEQNREIEETTAHAAYEAI